MRGNSALNGLIYPKFVK